MVDKTLCLISGGLDSITAAYMTRNLLPDVEYHALSFKYGQTHEVELIAVNDVSREFGFVSHSHIDLSAIKFNSALTGVGEIAKNRTDEEIATGIPSSYVPGRNIIFLSIAVSMAESMGAKLVVAGFNQLDYSGYPDCRSEFVLAFNDAINLGMKTDVYIRTPIIKMTKAQIITEGTRLGIDYKYTWSCYSPVIGISKGAIVGGSDEVIEYTKACGECDSCIIRRKGFEAAVVNDPTIYI